MTMANRPKDRYSKREWREILISYAKPVKLGLKAKYRRR